MPLDGKTLDLTKTVQIFRQPDERSRFRPRPAPTASCGASRCARQEADGGSDWAVFALANNGDEQIDRLLVAPHFRLAGSGLFWPDLGASRIAAITPSEGFAPDRQPSQEADVFRITLDPGAVVTFVAELRTAELPQLYLWDADAYKDAVNSYTLYRGIVLGIAGLLALFLTILFVVKGTAMFPATAALAWAVLAYICIDFGFWNKVIDVAPSADQIWRAGTEVLPRRVAPRLPLHLSPPQPLARPLQLRHHRLAGRPRHPPRRRGGRPARSRPASPACRSALTAVLGFGADRLSRHPRLRPRHHADPDLGAAAGLAVRGLAHDHRPSRQRRRPAGARRRPGPDRPADRLHRHAARLCRRRVAQGAISDTERQALALTGAGDIVWDWDVLRDRIYTGPTPSISLGLRRGSARGAGAQLAGGPPSRRPRPLQDDARRGGRARAAAASRRISACAAEDGHYRWFPLRARPVIGSDGEVMRCVGTLLDVTEQSNAEERLLHDAVHDNLTGLPNRELFLDRLRAAIARTEAEGASRPSVFILDIDRFKQVNDGFGLASATSSCSPSRAA